MRRIRKGKTYRTDINTGTEAEPDWASLVTRAVPFTWNPPPKK